MYIQRDSEKCMTPDEVRKLALDEADLDTQPLNKHKESCASCKWRYDLEVYLDTMRTPEDPQDGFVDLPLQTNTDHPGMLEHLQRVS